MQNNIIIVMVKPIKKPTKPKSILSMVFTCLRSPTNSRTRHTNPKRQRVYRISDNGMYHRGRFHRHTRTTCKYRFRAILSIRHPQHRLWIDKRHTDGIYRQPIHLCSVCNLYKSFALLGLTYTTEKVGNALKRIYINAPRQALISEYPPCYASMIGLVGSYRSNAHPTHFNTLENTLNR